MYANDGTHNVILEPGLSLASVTTVLRNDPTSRQPRGNKLRLRRSLEISLDTVTRNEKHTVFSSPREGWNEREEAKRGDEDKEGEDT